MINRTYEEYERLIGELVARPDTAPFEAVLEIGAIPDARSLLNASALKGSALHEGARKVGVNLTLEGSFGDFEVQKGDARELVFEDRSFDLIVCASTLEHIPDFWRALDEMKRVLRPGGWLVVSTPGFGQEEVGNRVRGLAHKLGLPDALKRGTITMRIHDAPYDYYRFSEYAYRDVVLKGLEEVEVWSIMTPPRIYGMGRKGV
ncbi:SAM-dependent methyltransferase [Bradymonadaceae bacterium TMQ3]|nr:SAM-dependent methyltransferase [Bradymonadaceae bacterium TMQ3]TXC74705.1 methyltransferase domain-containing protein [Bradymonadales bacterium TMQ1]